VRLRLSSTLALALLALACVPALASAAGPPAIEYFAPDPLRNHEATLRYAVDPEGLETEHWIEYGLASGDYFEHHYPWRGELPAGDEPVMRSAEIPAHFEAPLQSGTTYYWRAVAKNSTGTTEGPEQQFTTPDVPPARGITGNAEELSLTSVHLEGEVDAEGTPLVACNFRYRKLSEYNAYESGGFERQHWLTGKLERLGNVVPCNESLAKIGSGFWPVPVSGELSGLDPVPYLYRVEGDNDFELGLPGQILSFGPAAIRTGSVGPVTATEATVRAEIEKHWSDDPLYRVEYERDGQWLRTPWEWSPDGTGKFTLTAKLTCLQPGSQYRYRFAADNQAGTVYSATAPLVTPPGPAACAPPPAASPPAAKPKPPKKKRKKHQRKRVHRNTTIVAPRR
jgi:hypothetical protein